MPLSLSGGKQCHGTLNPRPRFGLMEILLVSDRFDTAELPKNGSMRIVGSALITTSLPGIQRMRRDQAILVHALSMRDPVVILKFTSDLSMKIAGVYTFGQ